MDAPGADLPGVFDLRRVGDADRIREAAAGGARAVCVGMGFIGAEVAASLRTMGCEVTVVEVFETALFRVLGREIAAAVRESEEPDDVEKPGQGRDRQHRVTQQTLTQGGDGGGQPRRRSFLRTAPALSRAWRGYAYSRTGSPSRIGVVGACRLRSGHV